jgi:hypothetical protein
MNRNWKWAYNPFERIAGWKAFGIGLVILCITTAIGYFGHTVFYGISIKIVPSVTCGQAFALQMLGLAILVFVMWITALLAAKHVRFQDILGTVTLSKYPLVLSALFFGVFSKRLNEIANMFNSAANIQEIIEIAKNEYALFALMSVFSIIILIWTIALLYNAFQVSSNLKGAKCVLLFIAALLISEIITNVIVSMYKFIL